MICIGQEVDRDIFWLHGYKGDTNSWADVNQYVTDNFKTTSVIPDFSQTVTTLEAAATKVETDINSGLQNTENPDQNFIIAHSLGGLVSRKMGLVYDDNMDPLYGGIVTFGTAHQGVAAADNIVNNPEMVQEFVQLSCDALSAGPLLTSATVGSLGLTLLTGFSWLNNEIDLNCELLGLFSPLAFPVFLDGLEDELTTYNVPDLPDLPALEPENIAVFYGIETDEEDLAMRFFGSFIDNPNDDYDVFGAGGVDGSGGTDQAGIVAFNEAQQIYFSFMQFFQNTNVAWYNYLLAPPFGAVGSLIVNSNLNNIADAWEQGYDWFATVDPTWKTMIGAQSTELSEIGCICITEDYSANVVSIEEFPDAEDCESMSFGLTECFPLYETEEFVIPSDGFVLEPTATNVDNFIGAPQLMLGSSHLQMRNDLNTEEALLKLFDGELGIYFATAER